jgi:ubiquinone/menaquinone biosynthesis C-methylase UbiE
MRRSPLAHARVFDDEGYAEKYARQHWKMAERFGHEYARRLTSRGFQTGSIIDVGCGFGATNLILAQRFAGSEVVGIDLSEPLLRLARRAAADAGLGERARFEKADVQEIPYPDNAFDVAINVNMVHLVENPSGMLDEIERVLAPDGLLLIADLRRSWLGLVEGELRSALTLREAKEMFRRSRLRQGAFSWGLLWWRFEA